MLHFLTWQKRKKKRERKGKKEKKKKQVLDKSGSLHLMQIVSEVS